MFDVVADGERLVAVGRSGPDGAYDAAVWTSLDGLRWERVSSAAFGGAGEQVMRAVTRSSEGVVAVGESTSVGGDLDLALWTADAGSWTRAEPDAFDAPGDQSLAAVVATGRTVVAVGHDRREALVVFREAAGRWHRGEVPGLDSGNEELHAIALDGGRFVAGGWYATDGREDATVLYAVDPRRWTRPPAGESPTTDLGAPGRQEIRALLPAFGLDFEVLAFGIQGSGLAEQSAVWVGFPIGG
jgi:hypothetical protein